MFTKEDENFRTLEIYQKFYYISSASYFGVYFTLNMRGLVFAVAYR